ncbi:ABC-type sugar transport system periplasmic component [Rubrobacter radiotolerans]|uniref:ABC-type sugar transport system periplasmic component n=1 Tax=Rubrobacter radiotolerans TaxID=42256 RepID=A0A023X465_RUBRA|nr:extracellular solute-binding protein [Rubrobacter radiotolerans]AHY47262.1 ABC-type sugar transport system periplasmic component [Rubrobacter radiotolerans]MDX5894667.1 extracellular solute-binding protein [Rubrobacter radiotolerans]SMC06505.1 carbohydrate ABC transporter substrate-binding protein, CUT1 family [Rubrobacter radiotolerans DSM 5868]
MHRDERPGTPESGAGGISRRDFLKLGGAGVAAVATLGVAGCGGGGGPVRTESGAIEVVFSTSPSAQAVLEKLIDRFNAEHEGEIEVSFRPAPTDTANAFDLLLTQFQAGGGEIDVIGGDVIWAAQFAANGWLADLTDRFDEGMRGEFLEGPVEAVTYEGAVYGVPWFTDAGMLYYRSDLLEESGFENPPQTWEELIEMATSVRENSDANFGFVFQGANSESGVVNGLEYINSFGGYALDPNDPNNVTIDSPESVEGLSMERRMIESGAAPDAIVTYTEEECQGSFLNGNAVFCRNWPYMYALGADESASNITQDQIGVAPLPRGEGGESVSGLGGANYYITATSDQETQDAAWEFVRYMSESVQQRTFALEASLLPTRSALYEDQEILDAVPVVSLAGEALERTVPRPVSPYYSDMSVNMAEQFNASLSGSIPPEEAVSNLQEEIQNIVDQG